MTTSLSPATLALLWLTFAPTLQAQDLDNEGTEFLCTYLPSPLASSSPQHQVELHLTGRVPATVDVAYPANSPTFTTTVNVAPGAITIVSLPTDASLAWTPDAIADNAVRATSTEEFTAYMINRRPVSSDAALALPVDVMNTEYILADYEPMFTGLESVFCVVARFDDTTVTITPSSALVGGRAAGVPFDVTLDAGQGYLGRAVQTGPSGTITGTVVESDRVIGVTNGVRCTNIPNGFGYCDHVFEVAPPVQTWDSDYLFANLPNRPLGSIYRVLASVDATEVFLDGVSQGTIDRGEFLEIGPTAADGRITSAQDEPIFVAQFMTSREASGTELGDPAQGNVIAPAQYKSDYTFSTVGGSQFAEHQLTIIAEDADTSTLLLDGAPVGASAFTSIAGSGYYVARLVISEGTHTTSSTSGHGITVEGYNLDDSYLYPGGAKFEFINSMGDENAPLCALQYMSGSVAGTARDDRPSEDTNGNGVLDPGEDLNGNGVIDEDTGIFFVQLDPAATNLTLTVAPFQPGDPVVTFDVTLTNPAMDGSGEVIITDGAGNTTPCAVALGGSIGSPVCVPVPNSTGQPALTTASGSLVAGANSLRLTTRQLPAGTLGYYVNSRTPGFVANPGGSAGNLCIADPVAMGRHDVGAMMSSAAGTNFLDLDLTSVPMQPIGPMAVSAGETWYWQFWYRDTVSGVATSNFCDAIELTFQ
jgi:hypothetical protein